MTKDVLLTISGFQFAAEQEADQVEIITAGDYYKRNGKHYIIYDEVMEGFEGSTHNIIKFSENSLEITKKGVTNVHMVFEKDKKNISYYYTPYGSLLIGIDATKVCVDESEHNINVDVKYALDVNYEHLADCKIKMNIKSKDAQDFKIS